MGNEDDALWRDFHNHLEIGQIVDGMVVEHRPFGMFVDIGSPRFLGLVNLPSMDDGPASRSGRKEVIRPIVGTQIRSVILGFGTHDGRQPRLSVRRSVLQAAEALQKVADLPIEQRRAFLQRAVDSHDSDVRAAAVWRARYLPEQERRAFLHAALRYPTSGARLQAVGRVVDLPTGERMSFLQAALEQGDERLAWLAVWESVHLRPEERVTFLRLALQHPDHDVVWRARFEMDRLSRHEAIGQ